MDRRGGYALAGGKDVEECVPVNQPARCGVGDTREGIHDQLTVEVGCRLQAEFLTRPG
jgi:hypothetical protein